MQYARIYATQDGETHFEDGDLEVETSDGDQFGKGDVLLADDTTGRGHVSRISGRGDLRAITVAVRG